MYKNISIVPISNFEEKAIKEIKKNARYILFISLFVFSSMLISSIAIIKYLEFKNITFGDLKTNFNIVDTLLNIFSDLEGFLFCGGVIAGVFIAIGISLHDLFKRKYSQKEILENLQIYQKDKSCASLYLYNILNNKSDISINFEENRISYYDGKKKRSIEPQFSLKSYITYQIKEPCSSFIFYYNVKIYFIIVNKVHHKKAR